MDGAASVTERIQFLRRVQRPPVSLESGLSTLRLSILPSASYRDSVAGPPPPRSWTEGNSAGDEGDGLRPASGRRPPRIDYFPGIRVPERTSLLHQTLKALAKDLDWHLQYDHVYLSVLPIALKDLLLSYVASYGPADGVKSQGLKTLFAAPETSELPDSTGSDVLKRLDLGGSIGHSETFKPLDKMWLLKEDPHVLEEFPPENWDCDLPPTINSTLRFPMLSRLSLAYPGPGVSWMDLLSFTKNMSQITHLSLAGWPMPHFPATPANSMLPGSAGDYNSRDEAIHIFHLIARGTPSLTYLSLAECHEWYPILQHIPQPIPRMPRPQTRRRGALADHDVALSESLSMGCPASPAHPATSVWATAWKQLRTLDLSQARPPPSLDPTALKALYDRRMFKRSSTLAPMSGNISRALADAERARAEQVRRGEAYTIIGPLDVVENIAERQERQLWVKREAEALDLGAFVKSWRVGNGLKIVDVEYGWGKDLVENHPDG